MTKARQTVDRASGHRTLTHLDEQGNAQMVDVGHKEFTERTAKAYARLRMKSETEQLLRDGTLEKGDALAVARIAGISAAKNTPGLIPLCHHIQLTSVKVEFSWVSTPSKSKYSQLEIETIAEATDRTGVEMEALVAASIAALTVYDMCKGVDDTLQVETVQLLEKTGGSTDIRRTPKLPGDEGD